MAYVPGFQYDVFASYASDDHDPQLVQFVNDLRVYLNRELGKLFTERSIFFDRQELIQTPVEWRSTLEKSAGSAAILVPFLSPSYASSDYCAKEWEWFCAEHPLRWPAGTEEVFRVCPVVWRALDDDLRRQIAPETPCRAGAAINFGPGARREGCQGAAADATLPPDSLCGGDGE